MAKGRRTAAQREHDLTIIAERYLRGHRQQDIADELDLTQQTVSNDLQTLYARWQESALLDIDAAKARELARIDELERTYWREYEASKEAKETTTTKRTKAGDGDESRLEASVRKEQRLGDPRYLAGVQWCIQRRSEIIGIDAPKRSEFTGKDGGAIEVKHVDDIRDDILSKLSRIAETGGAGGVSE